MDSAEPSQPAPADTPFPQLGPLGFRSSPHFSLDGFKEVTPALAAASAQDVDPVPASVGFAARSQPALAAASFPQFDPFKVYSPQARLDSDSAVTHALAAASGTPDLRPAGQQAPVDLEVPGGGPGPARFGTWFPIQVSSPGILLHVLKLAWGTAPLPSYLVCDCHGQVLPLDAPVCPGQDLRLWRPCSPLADSPTLLNPSAFQVKEPALLVATVLPSADRAASLSLQGVALADDQVAKSLAFIAGSCSQVVVLEPLLLLQCHQHDDPEPLRAFAAAIYRGASVISALPLSGHWVTFAWDIPHGRFEAWDSCPIGIMDLEVSSVHRLWSKVLGLTSSCFFFRQGPWRPPAPGLCGHFALADLWSYLNALVPSSHEAALAIAANFAAAFESYLGIDSLVRAPLLLGAGVADMVDLGLASLLKEKGVPGDKASERASQAVCRLGRGPIQSAMSSKQAWRNLKQLANNTSPPFQLVLQEELALSVQARAAGPDPAKRKHRQKPSKEPALPPLDQIQIPDGVFASEGRPLCQMELQSVGPQSIGVVLVSPAQAEPYLRLGQPVREPLLWL